MELNLRIIKVVFNLLQAMTDPRQVALERGQIQVHLKVPRPRVLHRTTKLLDRTHRLVEVVLQVLGRLSPVLATVAQGDRAPLGLAHPLLVSLKHLVDSRLRPERSIANVLHRVLGLARRISRLIRQAVSLLHDLVELGLNSPHPGRRRIRGSVLLLLQRVDTGLRQTVPNLPSKLLSRSPLLGRLKNLTLGGQNRISVLLLRLHQLTQATASHLLVAERLLHLLAGVQQLLADTVDRVRRPQIADALKVLLNLVTNLAQFLLEPLRPLFNTVAVQRALERVRQLSASLLRRSVQTLVHLLGVNCRLDTRLRNRITNRSIHLLRQALKLLVKVTVEVQGDLDRLIDSLKTVVELAEVRGRLLAININLRLDRNPVAVLAELFLDPVKLPLQLVNGLLAETFRVGRNLHPRPTDHQRHKRHRPLLRGGQPAQERSMQLPHATATVLTLLRRLLSPRRHQLVTLDLVPSKRGQHLRQQSVRVSRRSLIPDHVRMSLTMIRQRPPLIPRLGRQTLHHAKHVFGSGIDPAHHPPQIIKLVELVKVQNNVRPELKHHSAEGEASPEIPSELIHVLNTYSHRPRSSPNAASTSPEMLSSPSISRDHSFTNTI